MLNNVSHTFPSFRNAAAPPARVHSSREICRSGACQKSCPEERRGRIRVGAKIMKLRLLRLSVALYFMYAIPTAAVGRESNPDEVQSIFHFIKMVLFHSRRYLQQEGRQAVISYAQTHWGRAFYCREEPPRWNVNVLHRGFHTFILLR